MKLKSDDGHSLYPLPNTLSGYCCMNGNTLFISTIKSNHEGKGNFRKFLDKVEKEFEIIKVPTPSFRMRKILEKRGYVSLQEYFPEFDEIGEIMTLCTTLK